MHAASAEAGGARAALAAEAEAARAALAAELDAARAAHAERLSVEKARNRETVPRGLPSSSLPLSLSSLHTRARARVLPF